MKLSIVIPAYNEEEFLPHLLKSIDRQTLPKNNYEVIVVDNNSIDKTSLLAKRFGANVLSESRQGIPFARDTGARIASGDVVVCMDADCALPRDYLKKVHSAFNNDKLNAYWSTFTMPDAPLIIRLGIKSARVLGSIYKLMNKEPEFLCWGGNLSFRRSTFLKVGGYNLSHPLLTRGINSAGSDDKDILKKLKGKQGLVFCDLQLVLKSSGRRFKNRLLYCFFVDYLVGFQINRLVNHLTKKVIPVTSRHTRLSRNFS